MSAQGSAWEAGQCSEAGFSYSAVIASQLLSWGFTVGGDCGIITSWFPIGQQDPASRSRSSLQPEVSSVPHCRNSSQNMPNPISHPFSVHLPLSSPLCRLLKAQKGSLIPHHRGSLLPSRLVAGPQGGPSSVLLVLQAASPSPAAAPSPRAASHPP